MRGEQDRGKALQGKVVSVSSASPPRELEYSFSLGREERWDQQLQFGASCIPKDSLGVIPAQAQLFIWPLNLNVILGTDSMIQTATRESPSGSAWEQRPRGSVRRLFLSENNFLLGLN